MMVWDIIAMVFAGFLFAGIAMPFRIFYKKTPKWIIPVMAGVGMLSFQILSEYTWYPTTKSNLPKGVQVVATVPKSTWFRPWSYIKPNIFQFVVVDGRNAIQVSENIKQVQMYFFERRLPAQELPMLFDCQSGLQAHMLNGDITKIDMANLNWQKLEYTDKVVALVCQ